jgi:hypothetical protein
MNFLDKFIQVDVKKNMGIVGVTDEFFCVYLSRLLKKEKKNILVVVNSLFEANNLYSSLSNYTEQMAKMGYDVLDANGKLRDMANLALVNYIITNHEYTTLQKNYLDYFLGRNPQNVCYVDGFGTLNAVDETKKINEKNSGLFYLLLQSTKMEIKE